jgi:hypothetical protein
VSKRHWMYSSRAEFSRQNKATTGREGKKTSIGHVAGEAMRATLALCFNKPLSSVLPQPPAYFKARVVEYSQSEVGRMDPSFQMGDVS